jgi:gliding motility-associated transport system permease protein
MNAILLIARRELASYFRSWTGYIIIAAALFVSGLLFNGFALGSGMDHRSSDVLVQYFFFAGGVTQFAAVFISMRLLAGERENNTINLLASSPVRDVEIILGKYLSAVAFLAVLLAASVYMPILVLVSGKISFGHIFAGYLGMFLLGAAEIAIGTLASALTRSQILAVIVGAVMVIAMLVLWWVARIADRPISTILENLALWQMHFTPFQSGIIHLRDVVYYLAVTYVALFAATRVLEARRWR